ncbi:hypothetical protein SAMN02799642_02928 [Methylobacterium brachiatum]|nr:hypothetical protein SAMN02799642_02928 [Methylobacterium brachiatum]
MNVPAMSKVIRSMLEASGAKRRHFHMNAYSHARLRAARLWSPGSSIPAIFTHCVVVGVEQPGQKIGAHVIAKLAYGLV